MFKQPFRHLPKHQPHKKFNVGSPITITPINTLCLINSLENNVTILQISHSSSINYHTNSCCSNSKQYEKVEQSKKNILSIEKESNKQKSSLHDKPVWRVVRLDDNGNEYEMERNLNHKQAEDLAQEFTSRLHKQMYFSELVPEWSGDCNLSEKRSNTRSSTIHKPKTNFDKNYW